MKYLRTKYQLTDNFPLVKDEKGEISIQLNSSVVFHNTEILAISDSEDQKDAAEKIFPYRHLECGDHVQFNEDKKNFTAQCYGFLYLKENRLSVITPLQYNKNKTKAFLYIFPGPKGNLPDYIQLQSVYHAFGIQESIPAETLKARLKEMDPTKLLKNHKPIPLLIAQGIEPIHGNPAYFSFSQLPVVRSGALKENGSMDYHERNFISEIRKGTALAREFPAVEAVNGQDVFGKNLTANFSSPSDLKPGKNILPSESDPLIYIAGIDGALVRKSNTIDIEDKVQIAGDIDYSTGNINFLGNIEIKGSVKNSFQVQAGGDILIHENIDEAAVSARGNLIVNGGIHGSPKSAIHIQGSIQAKYIRNANIFCAGDLTVSGSIIHSNILCLGRVAVVSDKSGKIIGGEITGKLGIRVNTVGSESGQKNSLIAGIDPELQANIKFAKKILAEHDEAKVEIQKEIQQTFGEAFFKDPKKFLNALPDIRRQKYIFQLKELKNINSRILEEEAKLEKLNSECPIPDDVKIEILHAIHPESRIQVKESAVIIKDKMGNVSFDEKAVNHLKSTDLSLLITQEKNKEYAV